MSQAGLSNVQSTPSVPIQFTTDSGMAVPAANNLNVFGGTGASTSGAGSTITVNVTDTGVDWNVVTSATNPNALVDGNGYISKGAGSVTFVLPATASVGDTFNIAGYGNLWTLTQNAAQSITLGSNATTPGVTGSLTATNARDSIQVVCVTANTEFQVISAIGNLTII